MRQHHHETRCTPPFDFAGTDELVDHDLRTVGEVAELRFPDGQRIRLGAGITILETEYRFFRQHGIDHGEWRLFIGNVLQRDIAACIPTFAILIVQDRVAVHESAATCILAGQAY